MRQTTKTDLGRALIALRVGLHLAFDDLTTAQGTRASLHDALIAADLARDLGRMGYGADDLPNIQAVYELLDAVKLQLVERKPASVSRNGAETLLWLINYFERQTRCASEGDFSQALHCIARLPAFRYLA